MAMTYATKYFLIYLLYNFDNKKKKKKTYRYVK